MPSTTADRFGHLAQTAMTRLDAIAGVTPATRPAHLAQLDAVLRVAANQAHQADLNPVSVDRDADLWRLREPGYLRAVCDHPFARPSAVLVLLPVVLTWTALGIAELRYVKQYPATAARPSFFADLLAQPWYQGPVVLSLAIVLSMLWIIGNHRRASAGQRRADGIDQVVHQLEVDLHPHLAVLRAKLGPVAVEQHIRSASADLTAAAQRFGAASDRLVQSIGVIDQWRSVVDQVVAAVPELRAQVGALAQARQGLDHTAAEISGTLAPITTVVADVAGAASAAREAATRSEEAVRQSSEQARMTAALATWNTEHRDTLEQAQRPFTAVAEAVAGAAGRLDSTASALQDTAGRLKETIREVNWLAMVSDGLRNPAENHLAERGEAT